jgi:uncharacterized protein (TIGR00730 family)
MDIKELTREMHTFVRSMGWYEPESKRPQTPRNLAISLNLEASEVLEHFQWRDGPVNSSELADELADVTLYLLQLASLSGIDLEKAVLNKLNKNYHRTWDEESIEQDKNVTVRQPESRKVTVFGGSQLRPGEPTYNEALRLGSLLGSAGYTVLTGGYIGSMEAVSRGAAEAGGHVIGVTCDEIEAWRNVKPNAWVREELRFPTIRERITALIENCDAALALPGGVGTLAEIAMMWNHLLTAAISPRPLIAIGSGWQQTLDQFYNSLGTYIPDKQRHWLTFAPDIDSAFRQLNEALSNGKV